ncbi:Quercetin 3-O-methyltransferase 2 [Apostasia shenzhenica]|uniref:Quercetin 3-O-methyltransferase 2 n=1 Tax=Apostasia shenzhenica TaxID=1088818 RepID=A0A2I0B3Z8_9ASPA|nr:Quercetin 3-O-methyltransferase 2 [Apostasia shenzhenica]
MPFMMTHGKTFWDLAGDQPEFNDLFNEGMARDSWVVMDVVTHIGGSAFHGMTTLVDVGGGTGKTVAALVETFPELRCTVFDLPHVVNKAPKIPGVEFVGGDMFVEVPRVDAVLLKVSMSVLFSFFFCFFFCFGSQLVSFCFYKGFFCWFLGWSVQKYLQT